MVTPVSARAYARPELLAESGWLAERLGDPGIRLVDARSANEYVAGHLPGAVNMDGFGKLPRAENGDAGSAGEFAEVAGSLGIENRHTVVVYDTPSQRMGMVAWTFMYYGHADVRILDGGVSKWKAEGRPLSLERVSTARAAYKARLRPGVYCSLEQAKAAPAAEGTVFWDTRSEDEYTGKAAGFGAVPRLGHIPGAAHLDWNELLEAQTRTLRPAAELLPLLESRGISPDKRVVSYCNGGARGALGAFVLQLLGYANAVAYAGSFQQWSNQPDTAVEQ